MPFTKGNTIGQDTRFKTGQSGNPAGRPPDKLRRHIYAELDKIQREAAGKHEAVTTLQVLAERIVDDGISGCIASRKLRVDRLPWGPQSHAPAPSPIAFPRDIMRGRTPSEAHTQRQSAPLKTLRWAFGHI